MSEGKTKEYSNDEIKVLWKPDLCIHSGECVKNSPDVFQPKERPWIKIENSDSKSIMKTVEKCPSGALSYEIEKEDLEKPETFKDHKTIKIETMKNGPFIVQNEGIELTDSDGNSKECKGKTIALCRCGASDRKPFCDGSHTEIDFED